VRQSHALARRARTVAASAAQAIPTFTLQSIRPNGRGTYSSPMLTLLTQTVRVGFALCIQ
jgi:hypothetical protein